MGQAFGDLSGFTIGLFLFESVNEFDGREEPNLLAVMLDALDAAGSCGMCLAGARTANKDRSSGRRRWTHICATAYRGLVDFAGGEVEAGDSLVGGEAR